jgi:hypothetical protein
VQILFAEPQQQERIAHELARAMVCRIATAFDLDHGYVARVQNVASGLAAPSKGDHGLVFHEQDDLGLHALRDVRHARKLLAPHGLVRLSSEPADLQGLGRGR